MKLAMQENSQTTLEEVSTTVCGTTQVPTCKSKEYRDPEKLIPKNSQPLPSALSTEHIILVGRVFSSSRKAVSNSGYDNSQDNVYVGSESDFDNRFGEEEDLDSVFEA